MPLLLFCPPFRMSSSHRRSIAVILFWAHEPGYRISDDSSYYTSREDLEYSGYTFRCHRPDSASRRALLLKSILMRFHSHVIAHDPPFDQQKREGKCWSCEKLKENDFINSGIEVPVTCARILCHPHLKSWLLMPASRLVVRRLHPGTLENPSMGVPEVTGPGMQTVKNLQLF